MNSQRNRKAAAVVFMLLGSASAVAYGASHMAQGDEPASKTDQMTYGSRETSRTEWMQEAERRFDALDIDGDDVISKSEWRAHKDKDHKKKMHEGRDGH